MNLCRNLPHRALYSSVLIFTVLISKDVQQTAMLSSQVVHKQALVMAVNFIVFGWNPTSQSRRPTPLTMKKPLAATLENLKRRVTVLGLRHPPA